MIPKLLALINIVGHYGKRYRLIFGPDKTKVIITGSKHDMQYYEDTKPWSLYDQKLNVSKENELFIMFMFDYQVVDINVLVHI